MEVQIPIPICNTENDEIQWNKFKKKFNKLYEPLENSRRFAIFKDNVDLINKHNSDPSLGFKLGINQFSDLTNEEYQQKYLYQHRKNEKKDLPQQSDKVHDHKNLKTVPESIDYRDEGLVTEIQDMGQCEGCWSFAVVAAMEGCVAKETDELIKLSEQQLIDCNYDADIGQKGCDSGYVDYGMDWIIENEGLTSNVTYPYVGYTNQCSETDDLVSTITGYHKVRLSEYYVRFALFNQGPLVCSVDAHTAEFQLYSSGIFYDDTCGSEDADLNHSMVIVGYGSGNVTNTSDSDYDTSGDYWIVKNSWGTTFGDKGYIYMSRGSNNCGILNEVYYPSGCSLV
ncbi:cysteine protease [Anaeramoeba flamelloides]|uniref:Cysteine protease n=1 Tax=Anaeramoeba flamelloides TaxID=1746091 RepID=A0ABQ8Y6Q0_9EUKA|nr:cysteine protease [Anaeramoeba flamelloides]